MNTATVTLFFDQRRGDNLIKLLVTFERKQRLYSTKLKTDLETWIRLKGEANKDEPDGRIKDEEFIAAWTKLWNEPSKYNKDEGLGIVRVARAITKKLGVNFDFDTFKDELDNWGKDKPDASDNVLQALNNKAAIMRKANRIGNATNYELAAKSLKRFCDSFDKIERKEFGLAVQPKEYTLLFKNITPDFLTTYEQWMGHYGKKAKNDKNPDSPATLTTVGIYLRHLRAVFNDAITEGIVSQVDYPFGVGNNKYIIPAGQNIKKALSKDDVLKILRFECVTDAEQKARDFWIFSYLSNGMNMADICSLRWRDLDKQADKLYFVRKKTARTKKGNQSKIVAKLFPESWKIIERQGNQDKRSDAFVFGVIDDTMDATRKKRVIHQIIKMTNKWMGRIGKAVGIEGDTNTYAARHSFSTILLLSDAPLTFISQSLGHSNIKTTESYLGSFGDEKTKSYLENLIN